MTIRHNCGQYLFHRESNSVNKYAITSAGIGESLQRSAASLAEANNTLDQSIALTVAANNVVDFCHAA